MPRIVQGPTLERDKLVEFIARNTGLNESGVLQVLAELRDAVLYQARKGGAPLEQIQITLGHQTLTTTQKTPDSHQASWRRMGIWLQRYFS